MDLLFEHHVPEALRNEGPDAMRSARVVVVSCGIVMLVLLSVAAVRWAAGQPGTAAATAALGALAGLGVLDVRRNGRWKPAGAGLVVGLFVVTGAFTVLSGLAYTGMAYYLVLAPLIATMIFGSRIGVATALAACAVLVATEILRRQGFAFPIGVPRDVYASMQFRGPLRFGLMLLGIALLYDRFRQASVRDVATAEARLAALERQGTDLLFEVDGAGVVTHVSPPHAAVLGYAPEDLLGRRARELVHQEDLDLIPERLEEKLRTGEVHGPGLRLRARDGGWRWFEPAITAYGVGKEALRVIVVARDLSQRHELDQQLRQSQKMEAVGQLASGVAHDFNNLLMVVESYAEMLAQRLATHEDREAATEILRAAEKGGALTRQLLAVSRPSTSAPQSIRPNDVVRSMHGMLDRLVGEQTDVAVSLDPAVPFVRADLGNLEQILVNLCVNARDAMPNGGRLTIATHAGEDGSTAFLRVSDTGHGMDEATKERAFEAFFTTKPRGSGTGLGLYVVYSLVSQLGGKIRLDSEPGYGTSIEIELPATAEQPAERSEIATPARGAEASDATILVVEDRADVRSAIATALRRAGFAVLEASNGAEGVDVVRRHRQEIDLVVSDVVMPKMNGPQMVREIRSLQPGMPVLFLSGHVERVSALDEELADEAVVLKPIVPSALLEHVRAKLARDVR